MKRICYLCGSNEVQWDADFDADQIDPDKKGIYHTYTCRKCKARISVYELTQEQREELIERTTT